MGKNSLKMHPVPPQSLRLGRISAAKNSKLRRGKFLAESCAFGEMVGVLAQLVERLVRNEKVRSSSLLGSTSLRSHAVLAKAAAPNPAGRE